ncbi:MAG: hypothetical protein ABI863_08335 [Ginsengibacter sp.]
MKKLPALFFYALVCIVSGMSCIHNDHDTDISISEDDHYYSMDAHFSKHKMRNVEEYMDSRIGRRSNTSFTNSQMDAMLTLDDHTTFYIKKYPGRLEIKLDKNENSDESYHGIKSMCDGIKKLLAK